MSKKELRTFALKSDTNRDFKNKFRIPFLSVRSGLHKNPQKSQIWVGPSVSFGNPRAGRIHLKVISLRSNFQFNYWPPVHDSKTENLSSGPLIQKQKNLKRIPITIDRFRCLRKISKIPALSRVESNFYKIKMKKNKTNPHYDRPI